VGLRSGAWLIAFAISTSFHFTSPAQLGHSLHRLGVAHQTSLRSLQTMMSSFETSSREGGSPIQGSGQCRAETVELRSVVAVHGYSGIWGRRDSKASCLVVSSRGDRLLRR
jgi:hypothetical protein